MVIDMIATFYLPGRVCGTKAIKEIIEKPKEEDISEADVIIAVGRGLKSENDLAMVKELAELLGASITEVVQGFLDRITLVLWKSGVQIVLFLAGLQGISGSLYEAARVDGATEWEMFWKITLPMISPVIMMNVIYTIVAFFTDGTNPMVDYIYKMNFTNQLYESAAAMSWVYFVFALLLCGVSILLMQRHVYDSGSKN